MCMSLGIVAWGVPCTAAQVSQCAGLFVAGGSALVYLMAQDKVRRADALDEVQRAVERVRLREQGLLKDD